MWAGRITGDRLERVGGVHFPDPHNVDCSRARRRYAARFFRALDSATDAIAFVAEANGETVDDVVGSARAHADYLHNLRTGKKPTR